MKLLELQYKFINIYTKRELLNIKHAYDFVCTFFRITLFEEIVHVCFDCDHVVPSRLIHKIK